MRCINIHCCLNSSDCIKNQRGNQKTTLTLLPPPPLIFCSLLMRYHTAARLGLIFSHQPPHGNKAHLVSMSTFMSSQNWGGEERRGNWKRRGGGCVYQEQFELQGVVRHPVRISLPPIVSPNLTYVSVALARCPLSQGEKKSIGVSLHEKEREKPWGNMRPTGKEKLRVREWEQSQWDMPRSERPHQRLPLKVELRGPLRWVPNSAGHKDLCGYTQEEEGGVKKGGDCLRSKNIFLLLTHQQKSASAQLTGRS